METPETESPHTEPTVEETFIFVRRQTGERVSATEREFKELLEGKGFEREDDGVPSDG